jgi:antigen 43
MKCSIPKAGYPVHFKKDSLGHGLPFKDLEVSQQHRIIRNHKFEVCKDIPNDHNIFKYSYLHPRYFRTKEKLTYYHLECEEHSIIMVNGILTETLLDCNKDYKHRFTKIF